MNWVKNEMIFPSLVKIHTIKKVEFDEKTDNENRW